MNGTGKAVIFGLVALGAAACMSRCGTDTSDRGVAPAPGKPALKAPNVLFIVWDTTRADRLGPYGYDLNTTPNLTAFAKESVVFERAVSPGMWTLVSHSSLFTGLPVSAHGATAHYKWLDNRFVTMAEWASDKGYDTFLFSANPYLGDHTNLLQGFDVAQFPWDKDWKKKSRRATLDKLIDSDRSTAISPRFEPGELPTGRSNDKVKDAGPVAAEALLQWVDGRSDTEQPWFAFVNYMEPHVPRVPSLESRKSLFDDEQIARQLTLDQSFIHLLMYTVGVYSYDQEGLDTISTVYDSTLVDLDLATGALFDALRERGELDNTIVVLTADHGEQLGEHNMVGHKYSVYNPLVRVPLIVRYPEGMPAGRVADQVSTLDVFATVADLAGLEMHAGTESKSLRDRPINSPAAEDSPPVFTELVAATPAALERISKKYKDLDWEPYLVTYKAVEHNGFKLICGSNGSTELYDVVADPLETADLATAQPEKVAAMASEITAWLSRFEAYDASKAGPNDNPKELSGSIQDRLVALGYMEDGHDEGPEPDEDAPELPSMVGGQGCWVPR